MKISSPNPTINSQKYQRAFSFPDGKKIAVWFVLNVEHFEFEKLGPALQPHLVSHPEIANYSWRDYGNKIGFWRMKEIFDRKDIKVTAAVNAQMVELYPDITKEIRNALERTDSKWELMGHGWNNSTGHASLDRKAEQELISNCFEQFKRGFSQTPIGWLTPGFSISENTYQLLQEQGIQYIADFGNHDLPYVTESLGTEKPMTVLPYSLETNDISLCLSGRMSGEELLTVMTDTFDQLSKEAKNGTAKTMVFGLHTFLMGQPHRIKYLEKFIEHVKLEPSAFIPTGKEIFECHQNSLQKN